MLLYKNTFENIKTMNCNFPIEDQFYADDKEAIVADGITRDPIGAFDLATCSFEEMLEKYPRPSGAEIVAKEICNTFYKSAGTLKERLEICNNNIKKINEKNIKFCDYLQNDLYGAVASCIKIENDVLYYAYICDCGVIIYDSRGNIKFQTKDDKLLYSDPYINKIGIPWNLPEARIIVRRDFRNKPNNTENGKCVSYGAITGESEALNFIKSGKKKVEKGDLVLVYSDGFSNFLHEKDFINEIKNFNKISFEQYINNKSITNYDSYGKEKTIVLYKI